MSEEVVIGSVVLSPVVRPRPSIRPSPSPPQISFFTQKLKIFFLLLFAVVPRKADNKVNNRVCLQGEEGGREGGTNRAKCCCLQQAATAATVVLGFLPASLLEGEGEGRGGKANTCSWFLAEKKGLNSGGIRTSNKRLNGGEI